jgi:hypothetical protein
MITTYSVKLTFTEPILGTAPQNPEIYEDFIASRAAANGYVNNGDAENVDDELDTVPEMIEKGTTGFHRENDKPILYNYSVKGFIKDAWSMLARDKDTLSFKNKTAFKKITDGNIFVFPRRIPFILPEGEEISILVRPLRAQTAKGERVTLARSEALPVGTTMEFQVKVMGATVTKELLCEWLDYGELRGLGQWRNGGYGSFTYEIK